jgi:hypothetical protein
MIEAIENSAYAVWVRESPSIFAYTSILSLHAIGLAIIVGINWLVALRLLGFVPGIPVQSLRGLFPWMYVGFTVNAFSGLSLLAANLTNDLGNWVFVAKLVFLVFAMINLELMRMRVFNRPGALDSSGLPRQARTFAIASFVLWLLVIVAGRFTAYPNFVQAWLGF